MNSLTDRYVDAALRAVPSQKRSDIEPELRASIADAVDARVTAGEDPAAAEHAVLTDLGDPARLGAGYAGEPLHLIGPGLFLDYVRLLRVLAVIVLPVTAVAVGVVRVVGGSGIGSTIGAVIGTTLTTGVHLAFWTTVLFAVLERVPGVKTPLSGPWTPSMLPAARERGWPAPRSAEAVALVVWTALLVTAILLAPSLSPERDAAGDPINVLDPWLWSSGSVYALVGLLVLSTAMTAASHYYRRLAPAATLVSIAPTALLFWLVWSDHLLNPAFIAAVGWTTEVERWIRVGLLAATGLAIVTTLGQATVRALRR